jgi:hypothetical protein
MCPVVHFLVEMIDNIQRGIYSLLERAMIKTVKNEKTFHEFVVPPGLKPSIIDFFNLVESVFKKNPNRPKPIIVHGPSGVGKRLFVKIFENSSFGNNSEKNSVVINCAQYAGDAGIIRSELFGHEKGAFTGASGKKIGLIEHAEGGVLVLDEIGELAKEVQAQLLTYFDSGQYYSVGATQPKTSKKIKIIGTTNQRLDDEEKFRADFTARFHEFSIPPLYKRRSDILYYAFAYDPELMVNMFSWEIFRLLHHNWPQNIRELEKVLDKCKAIKTSSPANHYNYSKFGRTLPDIPNSHEEIEQGLIHILTKDEKSVYKKVYIGGYRKFTMPSFSLIDLKEVCQNPDDPVNLKIPVGSILTRNDPGDEFGESEIEDAFFKSKPFLEICNRQVYKAPWLDEWEKIKPIDNDFESSKLNMEFLINETQKYHFLDPKIELPNELEGRTHLLIRNIYDSRLNSNPSDTGFIFFPTIKKRNLSKFLFEQGQNLKVIWDATQFKVFMVADIFINRHGSLSKSLKKIINFLKKNLPIEEILKLKIKCVFFDTEEFLFGPNSNELVKRISSVNVKKVDELRKEFGLAKNKVVEVSLKDFCWPFKKSQHGPVFGDFVPKNIINSNPNIEFLGEIPEIITIEKEFLLWCGILGQYPDSDKNIGLDFLTTGPDGAPIDQIIDDLVWSESASDFIRGLHRLIQSCFRKHDATNPIPVEQVMKIISREPLVNSNTGGGAVYKPELKGVTLDQKPTPTPKPKLTPKQKTENAYQIYLNDNEKGKPNKSKACKEAGISRTTFNKFLKEKNL